MNANERATALDRARNLIEWLDAHPEIPFSQIEAFYSVNDGDDAANLAQLAAISTAAGIPVTSGDGGQPRRGDIQYVCRSEEFDRVKYCAAVVPQARMDRYSAEATYAGCVEPEAVFL